MLASLDQLFLASCASPPPNGQTCDDTMRSTGPLPDGVLLVVGVGVAIIVAALVWRYAKRPRPK
ncbi:hypothetical protein [Leifsonia sp. 21MFCrub1.1]|uniref:hypothetical protein n=1 Tax=Leifsonia sp. 21MFCrub1.1 TaxID=1798223 RepID=UPI000892A00F|nr:hypothetical protein [Leifsonia sp. 21MFCrub1.1]SEB07857.1 hypothetical protein SAMN04515680_3081 [Leifsonia sp. 21MFCrub1.1]